MVQQVLTTTVVGSYPQPDWLVDRAMLSKGVPRVRLQAMWRVPEPFLEQAQDDATLVAIRDMERAGIDIISDGEIRRESYSNRFATALDGVDVDHPGVITRPLRQPDSGAARGGPDRGGPGRSSCATCSSSAATRTARPRSPCPAPSRWPSRPATSSTATWKSWPWTSPPR